MSASSRFRTEVLTATENGIGEEWESLADGVGASPFLRPGWFELWFRAFSPGSASLLVARRDDRLEGVLPLVRTGSIVRSATNDHTPAFDVVAADGEATAALARGLLELRPARVALDYLDAEGAAAAAFRRAAYEARFQVLVRDWERPPYVDVDGPWEAYERALDGKLRRDLARRRRRLGELGSVEVDVQNGRERLDALLEEGFALEPSGWKDSQGTAIVSRPETRAFYTELARWAARQGMLRLSFLRLDGRPLAFQFGLEDRGVYYFVKGGYDRDQTRFAPAKLLVRAVLERAHASELRRFEFLGPPEPFKLEWTSTLHDLKRLQLFARRPAPLAAWAVTSYVRPAAARARRSVRRVQQLRSRSSALARPPHS